MRRSVISLLGSMYLVCSTSASADGSLSPGEAWQKIHQGALVIDVRSPAEFDGGHLPGAINIPYDKIEQHLADLAQQKEREIVLYCRSGRRSGLALESLFKHGYSKVYNAGGYEQLAEKKSER